MKIRMSADDIVALTGDFKGRIYVLLGSMVLFPVKKYSSLTGKYCSCVYGNFLQSVPRVTKQSLQEGLLSE